MIEVLINGKWKLKLPESSAKEWLDNMRTHKGIWEGERLDELNKEIKQGSVVYYIGAYKGDMAALLETWGAKLVVMEGTAGFWPLIKETWELNKLKSPVGFFSGLVSNRTTIQAVKKDLTTWPTRSEPFVEWQTGFAHLAESAGVFPEVSVNDFRLITDIVPDIITVDVEGSELEVMKGAKETLLKYHPTLILSIHPEFMFHNHNVYERELHDLIEESGYDKGKHLAYDHEHHWLYKAKQ